MKAALTANFTNADLRRLCALADREVNVFECR